MNCQDFETILIEVARDRMPGQLIDAAARGRAMEHAENCAPCAALLREERALSERLRAFSEASVAEEIPARLESALLTAFRQQTDAPVPAPRAVAAAPMGGRRWLLAAAALALLCFGLSLAAWLMAPPEGKPSANRTATGGGATAPIAPSVTPVTPKQNPAPPLMAVETRQTRRVSEAGKHRRGSSHADGMSQPNPDDAPREFVTQFFPVMQGGELIPLESAQIVRVRMPRASLIPLGIPVNQARADETIQADVLVSNEGLARAIRLVY
jgi:hypothetical protein